ncbi:MAG: serine/threonine protein kinase, partial [Ktedonobacteraceae bacterium]
MPLEGLQIGRYRFIRKLGSGGMGEVYLAEDARIGQQVAIKVIQSEASPYANSDATIQATRRFQHEAMAIARLDHPHILPLFDYGETSINGTTLSYLVMPFRREGSLIDWLGRRGGSELLSPQDVAHIVSQTADALQHSHDHQIIHQDIKPSNLLIRETKEAPNRPDVLLADFGIAKFTTATSATSQFIRGTPTYMAPEQWAGRPVPAADQYALAVMTTELLTGRPPFQGGSMQLMYQHLSVQPQAPSTLNAALPADVDTVLLHALAKEPSQRFASVAAFAQAFRQSVQYAGVAPRVEMPSPLSTPDFSREKDIYAALAISEVEAGNGTTRALTLPGGRRVRVSVPAGIQDGQIIRLEGQGEQSEPDGPMSALVLVITVKQTTDEVAHLGDATGAEPTIAPTKIRGQASGVSEASSTGSATGAHTPSNTDYQPTLAARSDPRGIPPSPVRAANANAVTDATILPTPVVRDASATGGSGAGARRSMGRWWLVIASMLFALLLIFGGAVYAVPY